MTVLVLGRLLLCLRHCDVTNLCVCVFVACDRGRFGLHSDDRRRNQHPAEGRQDGEHPSRQDHVRPTQQPDQHLGRDEQDCHLEDARLKRVQPQLPVWSTKQVRATSSASNPFPFNLLASRGFLTDVCDVAQRSTPSLRARRRFQTASPSAELCQCWLLRVIRVHAIKTLTCPAV